MQWAKSWFAAKEEEPEESLTTEQVIQALKIKRLEKMHESKSLEAEAKALLKSGNKVKAASVLKRRNIVETRLRQINGQLANAEQHNTTLESAAMANDIAASMKNGVREAQQVMSKVDVEDIDEIVDEMEDLTVQSYEVTEALSREVGGSAFMDHDVDDKIAAQLAEWEDEDQFVLPDVPVPLGTKGTDTVVDPTIKTTRI